MVNHENGTNCKSYEGFDMWFINWNETSKIMITVYSINRIPIRLTNDRWEHIVRSHPEMKNQVEKVKETILNPHSILEGDYGELLAVRYYNKTPLTEKYLIVVYKEISESDGFVLTTYFTRELSKRRKVIWKS